MKITKKLKLKNMKKPLDGISILDLSHVLSGPYCTLHLADNGARVIKVEKSKGDDTRFFGPFFEDGSSAYFNAINRGKESIVLDLKDIKGKEIFEKILSKVDVLVENFRPKTLEKLGFSTKKLLEKYPKLIICSISGYGHTGPMSSMGAYDSVIQGLSGAMSFTGTEKSGPTRLGIPICDLSAGLYAFGAICAALVGRNKTGKGTHIDISMLDCVFSLLENGLQSVLTKGKDLLRVGNKHHSIAPFDTFSCEDQEIIICCANDSLFVKLAKALNLENLLEDKKFISNDKRSNNSDELKTILENLLKTKPAKHWQDILEQAGVPTTVVNTVSQACQLEQIKERKMIVEQNSRLVQGTPFKYSAYNSDIAKKPSPSLNENFKTIYNEFFG